MIGDRTGRNPELWEVFYENENIKQREKTEKMQTSSERKFLHVHSLASIVLYRLKHAKLISKHFSQSIYVLLVTHKPPLPSPSIQKQSKE